jgi:DNA-directed RNA polymerase specialized sigma subunit
MEHFLEIFKDESQPDTERRIAHLYLADCLERVCIASIEDFSKKLYNSEVFLEIFFDVKDDLLCDQNKLHDTLAKYDSSHSSQAKLETYLDKVIKYKLSEILKLESRWHLLCSFDISTKRKLDHAKQKLNQALREYGIVEPDISRYIFAWQYFVPIYKNNRIHNVPRRAKKWPKPEQLDFAEAAREYNSNRFQSYAPLELYSSPNINATTIKEWMQTCIKALRLYSPLKYYARTTENTADANSYELEPDQSEKPWKFLEFQEKSEELIDLVDSVFRQDLQRIDDNIGKIRSKIPLAKRKAVMPLCYSHQFSILEQEQLADKVGVHQGTVSRYIYKQYEKPLLNRINDLTNEKPGSDPSVWTQKCVEAFLTKRFTKLNRWNLIDNILIRTIENLNQDTKYIIHLKYGQKMNVEEIINYFRQDNHSIEPDEIIQTVNEVKVQLYKTLIKEMDKAKSNYVNLWLRMYYRDLISSLLTDAFNKLDSELKTIMQLRYCQRLSEEQIVKRKPNCNVSQLISHAKQQLQNSLLQWTLDSFDISLNTEKEQVREVVEDWLTRLPFVEL